MPVEHRACLVCVVGQSHGVIRSALFESRILQKGIASALVRAPGGDDVFGQILVVQPGFGVALERGLQPRQGLLWGGVRAVDVRAGEFRVAVETGAEGADDGAQLPRAIAGRQLPHRPNIVGAKSQALKRQCLELLVRGLRGPQWPEGTAGIVIAIGVDHGVRGGRRNAHHAHASQCPRGLTLCVVRNDGCRLQDLCTPVGARVVGALLIYPQRGLAAAQLQTGVPAQERLIAAQPLQGFLREPLHVGREVQAPADPALGEAFEQPQEVPLCRLQSPHGAARCRLDLRHGSA